MNKVSLIKELSILFLVTSGFFVLVATHNFFAALFLFLSSLLIEKFFKKIHANRNKKITEIVQKARVELDTGNHQKMSFLFQKAIELDPNNCLLYYEYGNCNLEVNNYHKALNSFNQSLKINPKFTPAYLSRARAYFHLKDYKRALHDCNIVTNSHSDDPDFQFSHILKGGIYIYLEKFDKALYEFNYLLKINPDSAWGYVCKSELYCRWGKYQKSLENAQIALSMDSSIEIVYVWRAWAYYELEKIEEALEDCNFCVQNKVDNPKPFEILGLINESKNNLPEALKFFIKAKNLYENNQYEKTRYKKQYDETIQAINNIQVRLDKES